ncbi:MAG: glucose-6-phosphate isomerase [Persicimonas sp.]
MTLRYDASGLEPSTVGKERAVTDEDRAQLADELRAAHRAIMEGVDEGRLGFVDCPDIDATPIVEWAERKRDGYTDQVVIGIGGSSLGARAVYESMSAAEKGGLRTHFAENVDPVATRQLFERLDLAKTLFVVVTKSGTTVETMTKFWYAFDRVVERVGTDEASNHFVGITGPQNDGLRAMAERFDFDSFEVPPNVGGRFSVLTPVGLVPLALAGYDIEGLLAGAGRARSCAVGTDDVRENPLLRATADIFTLYERGVDQHVMMAYSEQLYRLADWFRQLWAESLGKAEDRSGRQVHVGMTPIKALGAVDQHSQAQLYMEGPDDKLTVFLETEKFETDLEIPRREGLPESLAHLRGKSLSEVFRAELQGTRRALQKAGRPTTSWRLSQVAPSEIGAFLFAWEFITATMGELLDIDAFNQPGVELGKKLAHGLLGRPGYEEWAQMAQDASNSSATAISGD